jgi:hypothetical protein
MNTVFRKHQFLDEVPSDRFMGRNPLSLVRAGKQIKDLDEATKVQFIDKYRPPGVVR